MVGRIIDKSWTAGDIVTLFLRTRYSEQSAVSFVAQPRARTPSDPRQDDPVKWSTGVLIRTSPQDSNCAKNPCDEGSVVDSSTADIVERDYRQAAVVDERPQQSGFGARLSGLLE